MIVDVPLRWQDQHIGTDVPPHENATGCPLFQNARLAPGGISFKAIPGIKRVQFTRLADTAKWPLDNLKRVVLFDASVAFGFQGVAVAIVDYTLADPSRRVLALGVNRQARPDQFNDPRASNTPWDPSVNPVLVLDPSSFGQMPKFRRFNAHEYGSIIASGEDTLVLDRWSRGVAIRNGRPRPLGFLPPARKPVLTVAGARTLIDDCEAPAMTSVNGAKYVVTVPNPSGTGTISDPYVFDDDDLPIFDAGFDGTSGTELLDDVQYQRISVQSPTEGGNNLAYRDLSFGLTEKNRIRFGFFWCPENFDGTKGTHLMPGHILSAKTVGLIFSDMAGLGGTTWEVPINKDLEAGIWHIIDEPWPGPTLTVNSWGVRVINDLAGNLFTRGLNYRFGVDKLEKVDAKAGPFKGQWRTRFTWLDENLNPPLESDPSPESDEIDTAGESVSFSINDDGFRGFFDTVLNGMQNDVVGINNDPLNPSRRKHIYLHLSTFGSDPVLGGRIYRRWTSAGGVLGESVV